MSILKKIPKAATILKKLNSSVPAQQDMGIDLNLIILSKILFAVK